MVQNWGFLVVAGCMVPGLLYSITCFGTKFKQTEAENEHRNINEDDVASILSLQLENTLPSPEAMKVPLFASLYEKSMTSTSSRRIGEKDRKSHFF